METHQKITCISGNRNPNQAFYIWGNGNFQSTPKISYILGNGNLPKYLYTSGNGNPENIFIFPEAELFYISGNRTFLYFGKEKNTKMRTLSHSEPWYIQNRIHIQNIVKHLRWKVLQKNCYLAHFSASAPKLFP